MLWFFHTVITHLTYLLFSLLLLLQGQTIMGTPHQKIDMGVTEIPEDVFFEYIEELRQIYTLDKYHLLDNNCNAFSNAVCEFLVGKPIPSQITGKLNNRTTSRKVSIYYPKPNASCFS